MSQPSIAGAGLGLRRELIDELLEQCPGDIDFMEIAPENWLEMGGRHAKRFQAARALYPMVCHGLSLSLGGPAPLDTLLLRRIRSFMAEHQIGLYTEHLSYTGDHGHLYDLLPIPFTEEAVRHVATRIRQTQHELGQRIAVENASYYVAAPINALSEIAFIRAVLEEADCWLHLDVNNVYVNSVNHGFDPFAFLDALPMERVVYIHTAGHLQEAEDLIVDTHGDAVIEPVWDLLAHTYARCGWAVPTLLERDLNIPPLTTLLPEVQRIQTLQNPWGARHAQHA